MSTPAPASTPGSAPPAPRISEAEARLDRLRRRVGLVAGPLVFAALWWLPVPAPNEEAARLTAVLGLVLVFWVSEAIPIPATALLGPALAVACGVGPAREIFAPFGDPILFLFLGSFVLARAMVECGLDRRFSVWVLSLRGVAASPGRLLLAFAALSAGLSGWLNNTATTAMLYPIALAVLGAMAGGDPHRFRFSASLMLAIAYASSIGGIATPVGTAPNLITLGALDRLAGIQISFFEWMLLAAPSALAMFGLLTLYLRYAIPAAERGLDTAAASRTTGALAAPEGPLSRRERNVLFAFGATVTFWVLPGVLAIALGADAPLVVAWRAALPEPIVALLGASLLFVLPVDARAGRFTMTWHEAARIDWGTLLLFGGGLALGGAMFRTGLAEALGTGLVALTGSGSVVALTFLFAAVAVLLTETTSNTATAAMLAPLAIASAQAAGVPPLPVAVAVALASSMAFMLPVSTPPNAIVFGSGCVPLPTMMRHGFVLDIASALVVPSLVLLAARGLGHL